jgi:hypothetical protein
MGVDQNTNIHKISTLPETTRKVARLEKRKLDEKQYISYEMIALLDIDKWLGVFSFTVKLVSEIMVAF